MRRIVATLFIALLCCCTRQPYISEADFEAKYIDAVQHTRTDLVVEIQGPLQLKITSPDGHFFTAYLDNAYDAYKQSPSNLTEILDSYVANIVQLTAASSTPLDTARIVPVIKDSQWIVEMRRLPGYTEDPHLFYEPLNEDLVVVYAEDTATAVKYLGTNELREAGIDFIHLRSQACSNLWRLLPPIRKVGDKGLYMLVADGSYEASLLLRSDLWTGGYLAVTGDIVVAIPSRDMLLVTGSKDPNGLSYMTKMVASITTSTAYRITPTLFTYRNGAFEKFRHD